MRSSPYNVPAVSVTHGVPSMAGISQSIAESLGVHRDGAAFYLCVPEGDTHITALFAEILQWWAHEVGGYFYKAFDDWSERFMIAEPWCSLDTPNLGTVWLFDLTLFERDTLRHVLDRYMNHILFTDE